MIRSRPAGIFSALVFFSLIYCPLGARADQQYLTASGCSVSNVGYLTELAKEYERIRGTKVFVRGGGSVVGIEDLRKGKVDFAASCRSKESGDPDDLEFIQVAWDVLAFVVHKSNPVTSISLDNVRAIYNGSITNWKELKGPDAPIKIFLSRPKRGLSGVEASVRNMLLKGKEPVRTPNTIHLASSAIVEQMVIDTPEGFGATGYSSARKRDLKMLKVNGIAPTARNIISGSYPLKRPLFILVSAKPKPEVKEFIAFVRSGQGQQFLRSLGMVTMLDIK